MLKTYVKRQLAQIGEASAPPAHALIEGQDWSDHPVFHPATHARE